MADRAAYSRSSEMLWRADCESTAAHCSVVTYVRQLLVQGVDIDRRMLDFLCGLDTEFSDMVDGSHLYFPSAVQLEDVIQKKLIVETVENFAAYKKVRKSLGLDKSGQSSPHILQLRLVQAWCWYATVRFVRGKDNCNTNSAGSQR